MQICADACRGIDLSGAAASFSADGLPEHRDPYGGPKMSVTTAPARGVLPDAVIRNPNSDAYLIGVTLQPALGQAEVQAWLSAITSALGELEQPLADEPPVASACVAFGHSFFHDGERARFGLEGEQEPAEARNAARPATYAERAECRL